jgi:hypothetical protein
MNRFPKATEADNFYGFLNNVCCFLKPVRVAIGNFRKPFHDSTSDLRKSFSSLGFDLENSCGFEQN